MQKKTRTTTDATPCSQHDELAPSSKKTRQSVKFRQVREARRAKNEKTKVQILGHSKNSKKFRLLEFFDEI